MGNSMSHDSYDDLDELPVPPRKDIPAADRELLELAARALGAEFEEVDGEGYGNLHFPDGSVVYSWNSLAFSGDALELAVKLVQEGYALSIELFQDGARVVTSWERDPDLLIATRRAITRAAAEIGQAAQG